MEQRGKWEGTATELRKELGGRVDVETKMQKNGWPKNPKALSSHLRRITPNLQEFGIVVDFWKSGERKISIGPITTMDDTDAPDEALPTHSIEVPLSEISNMFSEEGKKEQLTL